MRALSIRSKMTGSFLILVLSVAVLSFVGYQSAVRMNGLLRDVQTNWLPSVRTASQVDALTGRYTTSVLRHILTSEPKMLAAIEKDLSERARKLTEARKAYEPLISSAEERALYDEFSKSWAEFTVTVEPVFDLSRTGRKADALALYESRGVGPRRAASVSLDKIVALNEAGSAQAETLSTEIYSRTRTLLIAVGLLAVGLAVTLGAVIVRSIARDIASVVEPMNALAAGDASVSIPHQGARTEIGTIATAVQVFKNNLIRTRQLEAETALARASAEEQRKAGMRQMADGFEQAVGGIVGLVSSAASELQATAQSMSATAGQTAGQSTSVAAAAAQAAANVNTVAAAAEELGSSVAEIGRQVSGSADLAQAAVAEANATAGLVQDLAQAASRIGDVVALISQIAGQTNLLALNATIEAARGRGGPGLRGGGGRGEGTRQPDGAGDRGDHDADRPDPGLDGSGGGGDRGDRHADPGDRGRGGLDRGGGGGAGGGDSGNRAQRLAGLGRHGRGDPQHHGRGGRGRGDGGGGRPGSGLGLRPVAPVRAPHRRGRALPRHRARGITVRVQPAPGASIGRIVTASASVFPARQRMGKTLARRRNGAVVAGC